MAVAALDRADASRPVAAETWLRARPRLAAVTGGLLLAASMPPVHFLPGLLGVAVLVHLLRGEAARRRPGRAFELGWLFGLGFLVGGLHWIAIAFFADAERYALLALPAVLGLCAFLALSVGAAAWAVALARFRSVEAHALAFGVCWTVAEMARAGTIVDFPWNPVALAWTATDATMQGVALLGTYGLSLATVAAAGLLARALEPGGVGAARWAGLLAPAALTLALLAGGAARLALAGRTEPTGVAVRLVQGNVPQAMKWDRARRDEWFVRHLELTARPAASGEPPAVVVWPESAVPFQLESDEAARDYIARAMPAGAYGLLGGDRFVVEDDRLVAASNSLFVIDSDARLLDRYDKVDLVPFGEFTPYRWLFGQIGLGKLVAGSVDFGPGPSRRTIEAPGLPPFSPLICFEAVFPGRAAPNEPRPAWLLNVTNDAWFGTSAGPYQHLAQARLRAVEEGLPLARAANTGISALTDAYGRVVARLGLNETGVIDARLPAALPRASFARRHEPWLPWALLAGAALLALALEALARRRQPAVPAGV